MLEVRKAIATDVEGIRDVFMATYGDEYPYHEFLELESLTRMVFSDDSILLVAVESETQRVLGTASVVMDVGAFGDLTAEFGRLAVHPDARGQGVGARLMEGRLALAREQIHVGIVENRVAHPFSQKISLKFGFVPVGFLPWKLKFIQRESISLYLQHFGNSLSMRRNHPRLIPDAFPLAEFALRNCGIECDAIAVDDAVSYPHIDDFELQELSTDGFSTLLRLQRGRVHRREVFGPVRLHYGLFQLQARQCNYLIARRDGNVVGGIGFLHDQVEQSVKIFELLSVDNQPLHFLIRSLEQACMEWGAQYVEVDVNAHAPQMQQTFLECGFLPCGYLPASVFHDVERLDAVRMSRLLIPPDLPAPNIAEPSRPITEYVLQLFRRQGIIPTIANAIGEVEFFDGMTSEQAGAVAEICTARELRPGDVLFEAGGAPAEMYLVLQGRVGLYSEGVETPCDIVERDLIGETSMVAPCPHTLEARSMEAGLVAVIERESLLKLLRRRSDISVLLYRNLARSMAVKLRRSRRASDLY